MKDSLICTMHPREAVKKLGKQPKCYDLTAYVPPCQNSYVENLMPKVMVLGGGTFGEVIRSRE